MSILKNYLLLALFLCNQTGAMPIPHQGTWESTLQARDINHDGVVDAYYDTTLDITWLADLRRSKTSGYDRDGLMSWEQANVWAGTLSVYGIEGWRLPRVAPKNGEAFTMEFAGDGSSDVGRAKSGEGWGKGAEFSHLFYVTLGNVSMFLSDIPNSTVREPRWGEDQNTGGFVNFSSRIEYWSESKYSLPPTDSRAASWCFGQYDGHQWGCWDTDQLNAVAVRDGDIYSVSEPSTTALVLLIFTLFLAMRSKNGSVYQPIGFRLLDNSK